MQGTYRARGIVLRKTKLGENDLILTLMVQDGSQVRAVAKGARKPTSQFAARLELYSVVDVLLACGRSLDIVKEVRLVQAHTALRQSLEHSACAAPMVELLARVTQDALENSRLFDLTCVALESLVRVEPSMAPAICAAHLLKTLAFIGVRPGLHSCVVCGQKSSQWKSGNMVRLSYGEGGILCPTCATQSEAVLVPWATTDWVLLFLGSTFAQIEEFEVDPSVSFALLRFCQEWSREHVGRNLKSLNFLFTCGLY